ncbi:putative ribonuclease H protein [Glycine soja]
MLCIQETKREHIDKDMCQALWGNQNVGWEFLPSINSAGGLLCVWNEQVFKTVRRERGRGYILLEGVWTMENQKTYIVNIYSPCDNRHKRELWESLKQLRQQDPEGLWCFLGDFNSIRHHSERKGVTHRGRQANNINEFNEWIADIEFEEIPSVGRQLTWFKPNETTKSKLDRAPEEGIRGNHKSTWWKDLVSLQHQQQNLVIKRKTTWKVGGGEKFRFWEDPWTNNGMPLMEKYPRLYHISSQQKTIIMQIGSNNTGWEWKLTWRRDLFDSEVEMADTFIGEISQQKVQPHREDIRIWKHDQSGSYSTKSGYDLIRRELTGANHDSDFVDLWKLKIPTKAAMFAWRLIRDRLPTRMNLRRRQVLVNDSMCPLCGLQEEEAAHLFFSCSKSLLLWWESLSWVNLATALPQNPRDHYLQHTTRTAEGKKLTRWKCRWIALTWTIWNHRNKIVFQNHTFDRSKLLDEATFLLWTWVKSMEKDFAIHFNQWSSNIKEAFSN